MKIRPFVIILCKCVKTVTVTDSNTTWKSWIKSYLVNFDSRVVPMKANIYMVVMEMASQQLDEYKNDSAISSWLQIC